VAVLEMPDIKQGLLDQGIEAAPSSPERFAAYIKSETGKWTKVIKAAGIKVD
jgi:tripartite-type tricarboxylate transporter receptor subunit TctC